MTSQKDSTGDDQGKKSLYQRYKDVKASRSMLEQDLRKFTGMTKHELQDWAKDRDGVAGKLDAGPASGFAGYEAAHGVGGWGTDAQGVAKSPPQQSKE
ncbi:hypothetical protein diail_7254 [Diaporthe ilicicola]|nr:hypothetical protein diail_7254 [Diaporthe ilicicola]